ncbi:hypothetical protein Val02_69170 [Virgisporangium aliadipatigenens]|uniref:Uncharacterized protein n=1 Tax=Virgisporangium aliadipatigenens TaxID=741659 RepID=A0A8J3YUG3_9ACTN|nr:hypothetical protein [Virgisporangium aliadipatigenens]GIJ50031.1 hypothetical protein Val02_69170 [Virgisporangium aliadipatigenens]
MDKGRTPDASVSPRFKLIFSTVVGLTVVSLILNVVLALFGGESAQVQAASEACSTAFKMGFGAIVGLIGGRSM